MKKRYWRGRAAMAAELRIGRKWLGDSMKHLDEAEEALAAVRKSLADGKEHTEAEFALMREAIRLCRDAEDQVRFYDGVVTGMLLMERAAKERVAVDSVELFGPSRR